MNISFEQLSEKHRFSIMDIFNYYIENSFSAYSDNVFDYDFYNKFIDLLLFVMFEHIIHD